MTYEVAILLGGIIVGALITFVALLIYIAPNWPRR